MIKAIVTRIGTTLQESFFTWGKDYSKSTLEIEGGTRRGVGVTVSTDFEAIGNSSVNGRNYKYEFSIILGFLFLYFTLTYYFGLKEE